MSCPPCVEPIKRKLCSLLPPGERGECERRFDEQFTTGSPKAFVDWLKSRGIPKEDFLRALEE